MVILWFRSIQKPEKWIRRNYFRSISPRLHGRKRRGWPPAELAPRTWIPTASRGAVCLPLKCMCWFLRAWRRIRNEPGNLKSVIFFVFCSFFVAVTLATAAISHSLGVLAWVQFIQFKNFFWKITMPLAPISKQHISIRHAIQIKKTFKCVLMFLQSFVFLSITFFKTFVTSNRTIKKLGGGLQFCPNLANQILVWFPTFLWVWNTHQFITHQSFSFSLVQFFPFLFSSNIFFRVWQCFLGGFSL